MTGRASGMEEKEQIGMVRQGIVLALILALAFNFINGLPVAIAVGLGLMILLPRIGGPAIMTALALFGIFLFNLINRFFGIGVTLCHILLAGAIIMMILHPPESPSKGNRSRMSNYLVWVALVWVLIIFGYLTGPKTDYSSYSITYFMIYGTFYLLLGIMVSRFRVRIEEIILPCLLLFSCIFPQIGLTPLQMPVILDPQSGLRDVLEFSAIYHPRLAGLLFVMVMIYSMNSSRKIRILPEVIIAALICLSVIWFSYTRQVMAALIIALGVAVIRTIFSRNFVKSKRQKILIIAAAVIFFGVITAWLFSDINRVKSTRMGEGDMIIIDSNSGRLIWWSKSWEYIEKNPLIGYGMGSFSDFDLGFAGIGKPDWPHNWFIEVWFEYGLAGLLLFLIGAVILLRPLFINSGPQLTSWAILGAYWFIVIQLSGDIARNSMIFFFISISALEWKYSGEKNPVSELIASSE